MSTFIERLPSLRRRDRDPPSTDHRRLESTPPSPQSEHESEEDLTEAHQDDSARKKKKKKTKKKTFKGKEVDPSERGAQSPFEVEVDHEEFAAQQQDGMPAGAEGTSSYPPTNEEELETKRIEENLKRWELLEKQRRKAARESRSYRQPNTLIGDVASYVAGSPAVNGYAPNRQSTGTDSGHRLSISGWTAAKTRDSQDSVELNQRQASNAKRLMTASPPPIEEEKLDLRTTKEKSERPRFASPVGSEDSFETAHSRSTSQSDPENPFSPDPTRAPEADLQSLESMDSAATERGPRQPQSEASPRRSRPSLNSDNPFKNPLAATSSPQADLDAPLLASPNVLSPSASPRTNTVSTLQVPQNETSKSKSPKGQKHTSTVVPPLVRPLDLPEATMPRMEPNPASGHFRRAQHDPQQQQEMEEEMEADRAHGRWWTDWICGCREVHRREEQDGRTNPFE
ncbi:hypothetical protein FRB96_005007 [Tulasnella sp. 330]|nr:hypothetical protein FRB96_005007 [Tulasnella sp. 330]